MSQGSYRPTLTDVAEHRQRSMAEPNPGFQTEPGDVLEELKQADRPLSRSDLELLAHHGNEAVMRRINKLLAEDKIESRTDGPDGRVVYYQPKGMDFAWGDDGEF